MSGSIGTGSFLKQKKMIEEKKLNFQRFMNKRKSMTPDEIQENFKTNHPNRYFEKVQQLKVPFKEKLELMDKFFQKQLDLLQGQQYCSPIHAAIGPPVHTSANVLDNKTNNTSSDGSPQAFEVTRSGRITKRPLFYQDDVNDKSDDFKPKSTKKQLVYEKKENSEKPCELNKVKEPSKSVVSVLSRYEQKQNALFDSLLEDDNKSDTNKCEENSEKNETLSKRKFEDTFGIENKSDVLDIKLTPTPKKSKPNKFFKSKNVTAAQPEGVITCDTSDSEDNTIVDVSEKSSKVNPELDPIKRGRVSPVIAIKKRNRKKVPIPKKNNDVLCPICNIFFPKKDIDGHASNCTRYSSNVL